MINWVVGGLIIGFTVFIIIRTISKVRKGESSCCDGCTSSSSKCSCSHKP